MTRIPLPALIVTLAVTLAVRVLAAGVVEHQGIGDPNYYEDVARAFARGEGLTSRCVWNLLVLPADLPAPGCAYWGPGVPLAIGSAYALFGISSGVAQVTMVLLSLVFAVLALLVCVLFTRTRSSPLVLGLLLAFHLQLSYFSVTTDTPIPFALAVNASLLPLAHAHAGWSPGFFLALPGALAAQLTRADGLLLPGLVFLFAALATWRGRFSRRAFVLLAVLYLAGWGGWLARNRAAFGTPFPSSMVEGLALNDYSDLFLIYQRPSFARLMALGPRRILADKIGGLFDNLRIIFDAQNPLLLALGACALPTLWRDPRARPYLAYLVALVLAMTFAFNHQSRFGSLMHSLPALLPFLGAAALLGREEVLSRIELWQPGRSRFRARALVTLLPWLVVLYTALTTLAGYSSPSGMGHPYQQLRQVRASLRAWWQKPGVGGADVRVMSNDSLDLVNLLPATVVQEPRDPGLDAVFELAARYRLKYLVVFRLQRFTSRPWDQPRYTHARGELVHVGDVPAQLTELDLSGIALYEFRLPPQELENRRGR